MHSNCRKGHNSGFVSVLLNFSKSSKWCQKINFAVCVHIHMAKKPTLSLVILQEGEKPERTVLWSELVN